jgi:hypothetical protein
MKSLKSEHDPPLLRPRSGKKHKDDYEYVNISPDTTVTILLQRDQPSKPRNIHIPFWGRSRGDSKKIALDQLWELHYRLERIKKAVLPVHKSAPPLRDPIRNGYGKGMDGRGGHGKMENGIMRDSSMRQTAVRGTGMRGGRGSHLGRGRGNWGPRSRRG